MTNEEALKIINASLNLEGSETHDGKEIKCYVRDLEDNGVNKCYLNAEACANLSAAFAVLGDALRKNGAR